MFHNPKPYNSRGKFEPGTIVRIKKTGEFARIERRVCLMDRPENFLHYEGIIEGRGDGTYAMYDEGLELECLPGLVNKKRSPVQSAPLSYLDGNLQNS